MAEPVLPTTSRNTLETPSSDDLNLTSPVMKLLRWGLHAMLIFLVVLGALRLILSETTGWPIAAGLAGACAMLIGYVLAVRQPNPTPRQMRWWLAGITTLWVALMVLSPDFAWVCFPLFFLHLHILTRRHAMVAIAVMTVVVIVALSLHAGGPNPGLVLGPLIGAVFSVVVGLAYSALHTESRARLESLIELRRTQGELAASQREAGRLAEQERLAAEIHDTVAQGLASLVLLSRAARGRLDRLTGASPDDPDLTQVSELVGQSEEVALSNLAEARRVVAGLAPPALDRQSLSDAMAAEVRRHQQLSDVDTSGGTEWLFRTEGEPTTELPESMAGVLLRAGQASWSNAFKHARAGKVVTTLTWLPDAVALDIVDDGVGFDPDAQSSAPESGGGYGLDLTRARVEQAGGTFTVESSTSGTAVAIGLPLPAGGPKTAADASPPSAVSSSLPSGAAPTAAARPTDPTATPHQGGQ